MTPETLRFTPPNITKLAPGEVFVFGSNLDGRHGKGAAKTALQRFGARYIVAEGLCGQSYALPTVGHNLSRMRLSEIKHFVGRFINFAANNPDLTFLTTMVGCGLAGHRVSDIAPMFAQRTGNVILPVEFYQPAPPLDVDHSTLAAYIDGCKEGDRVCEMGKSCLQGVCGTVYLNEAKNTCIMWDTTPGPMGTSFTGGARRLSDIHNYARQG